MVPHQHEVLSEAKNHPLEYQAGLGDPIQSVAQYVWRLFRDVRPHDQTSIDRASQWRVLILPCLTRPTHRESDEESSAIPRGSPICPEFLRCPCEPRPVTASSYSAVLPPTEQEVLFGNTPRG